MSNEHKDCISGVECTAQNCVHNCHGKCDAKSICINSKTARTESETCCHTFELK